MKKGLVHLYIGDGKGKTTAALGQAIRALGQGWRVIMIQFLKGKNFTSGEEKIVSRLPGKNFTLLKVNQTVPLEKLLSSSPHGFLRNLKKEIEEFFPKLEQIISKDKCDLLILDEILNCYSLKLVSLKQIIALLEKKRFGIEIILTGRQAPVKLYSYADYISQISKKKHPFERGIKARRGIEY
jgi:cob(I)alamin adenosyltransferase